jgi:phosphoserine aminotransferase
MTMKRRICETDIWSTRAEEETRLYGNTHIIASSKESNFNYIPKDFKVDEKLPIYI